MRIPPKAYRELLALFDQLAQSGPLEPAVQTDVDVVRQAVAAPEQGPATIETSSETARALHRLLAGRDGFLHTRALLASSRRFADPPWDRSYYQRLYERSLILQSLPADAFHSSSSLIDALFHLRPAIVEEQRGLPPYGTPAGLALSTLVRAIDAGRGLDDIYYQSMWLATGRDLYERSAILQGEVAEADLATPIALVRKLAHLLPRIIEEQGALGSGDTSEPQAYSLGTLVRALNAGGVLTADVQNFTRLAGGWDLYQRSAILRGEIIAEDLASPQALVLKLTALRPAIIEEQRRQRGVGEWELSHYALSTLIVALDAEGRLPGNAQRYVRQANAADLHARSRILQEEITASDIADALVLLEKLIALRPRIVEEQRQLRGQDEEALEGYALGTLMQALDAAGRLGAASLRYRQLASAREIYGRSPLLQRVVVPEDPFDPLALVRRLHELRPAIIEEQRTIRGIDPDEEVHYSLGTLVLALESVGKLRKSSQDTRRLAGSLDLYLRSPLLQGIAKEDLETPQTLAEKLSSLRQAIIEEQRDARGLEADAPVHYALNTFVRALYAAGRLRENVRSYEWIASARDLYDRSPILQQQVRRTDTMDPKHLLRRLVELRPAIVAEQQRLRGDDEAPTIYTYGTLVDALIAGGRVADDHQSFRRLISARDLYDASPLLQREIPETQRDDPRHLLDYLVALRPQIVAEQQIRLGPSSTRNTTYSLSTLVKALAAGGRLSGKTDSLERLAGARDLFERSLTIQAVPQEALASAEALMEFLLARRDRIAIENRRATGQLDPSAFTFPGAAEYYSLVSLVGALSAASIIDARRQIQLVTGVAGPLEYFLNRREAIEPEVRKLGDDTSGVRLRRDIDRSVFTWREDPTRPLSKGYISNILKWGQWFLLHPDLVVRSVFGGDEISLMAVLGQAYLVDAAPADIRPRLDAAAEMAADDPSGARREAVSALMDLLDHYDGYAQAGIELDSETLADLGALRQIVEWNRDALGEEAPPPDEFPPEDGSPSSGGGSSSGGEPLPDTRYFGGITVADGPTETAPPPPIDDVATSPELSLETMDVSPLAPTVIPFAAGASVALPMH